MPLEAIAVKLNLMDVAIALRHIIPEGSELRLDEARVLGALGSGQRDTAQLWNRVRVLTRHLLFTLSGMIRLAFGLGVAPGPSVVEIVSLILPHIDRPWLRLLDLGQRKGKDAIFHCRFDVPLIDGSGWRRSGRSTSVDARSGRVVVL